MKFVYIDNKGQVHTSDDTRYDEMADDQEAWDSMIASREKDMDSVGQRTQAVEKPPVFCI